MLKSFSNKLLGVAVIVFYIPGAHAAANYLDANFLPLLKSSFVVSFSWGPSWENAGQAQTLNLSSEIIKTYTANKTTNSLQSGELFLGIKQALPKQLEGQIGLGFVATGSADLSGNIWDDANPVFNNHTYQYKVNHNAVTLKGRLLGDWNWPIIPWISAALGIGFNNAHGFSNTPVIYEAVQMPNFSSKVTTAFTYTLGAGIQRQFNPHWQVGAGYEFSDWGKSQLGSAKGSSQGPSLSHLYTNSILFNLTYVA